MQEHPARRLHGSCISSSGCAGHTRATNSSCHHRRTSVALRHSSAGLRQQQQSRVRVLRDEERKRDRGKRRGRGTGARLGNGMNGRGLLMRLVTSKKGISVHTKVRYAFLNLTMGPASLDTQKMARTSETQNCNGMFQNTQIVMTLL
jgi:hypothetical protein